MNMKKNFAFTRLHVCLDHHRQTIQYTQQSMQSTPFMHWDNRTIPLHTEQLRTAILDAVILQTHGTDIEDITMIPQSVLRIADAVLHHNQETLNVANLHDIIHTATNTHRYLKHRYKNVRDADTDRCLPFASPLYALNASKASHGYYSLIYHRGKQVPLSVDLRQPRLDTRYTNHIQHLHPSNAYMSTYLLDNMDKAIHHTYNQTPSAITTFMRQATAYENNGEAQHQGRQYTDNFHDLQDTRTSTQPEAESICIRNRDQ